MRHESPANVELHYWYIVAKETLSRGHERVARGIWDDALNEYAASTGASPTTPAEAKQEGLPIQEPPERARTHTRIARKRAN